MRTAASRCRRGQAKEFALVHTLVGGADGGRIFVRCFDAAMNVRENVVGGALASITTLQWSTPSKARNGGAAMADASLNKRMTVQLGAPVAFAQIGIIGFDGQIEFEALRLYRLPEVAPAVLNGTPLLPQFGQWEFAAEVSWDLPDLAPGATSLLDVTVIGARQGDIAQAALASSTGFIELDTTAWSNKTVRVMARNISPTATFDLGAAMLSVAAHIGFNTEAVGDAEPRVCRVLPEAAPIIFPIWLVTHRELQTSRRVPVVFDLLADALSSQH
ncbi:hypothetical protein AAFN86_29140 [Roseomonas sp. CAU 1739]|uniref:hypothetical protein n=1 Tax=Roseomonas sp. CAU 1739 TaxID=3140364 RepID=UPI00325A74B2